MNRQSARLPWWAACIAAVLGGLALDASTPALSWWPAAFVGAALVLAAVWQQKSGLGFCLGALAGASFWGPQISWLTLYLGPVPWLALSTVMVAWFALFGLAAAFATSGLTRFHWPVWLRALVQSIAVAGLWVAREQVQSSWPYGGFAWGRIAHTQAESPLVAVVSWLGFAGFSGLIVFICALPVSVAFARKPQPRWRDTASLLTALGTVVVLCLLSLVPPATLEQEGTVRVAAVQGNSKSGIFDDRENGDVFRAHLEETQRFVDQLQKDGEHIDVLVWPENSAEFAVDANPIRAKALGDISAQLDAPVVVGTILANPDGSYSNSSLVFDADGATGDRYDKRRPVPFAEYMPSRSFFHALAPDLVDLVQLDYAPGQRASVLSLDTNAGVVRAGIAICFDIIFDDQAVAMTQDGAQIIFAQTNNADFGRTDESAQQLQIAQLRAVEMGRPLVNNSTVGTSAIILPDGSEIDRLPTHTPGVLVATLPLYTGDTPALRFGAMIAAVWIGLGLGGLLLSGIRRRTPVHDVSRIGN